MTAPHQDDARRFIRPRFAGPDGSLLLWECFVEQCPEMDLVADALDELAGFHDYHRQPATATKYRAEAAALRKRISEVTRQPPPGSIEHSGKFAGRLP